MFKKNCIFNILKTVWYLLTPIISSLILLCFTANKFETIVMILYLIVAFSISILLIYKQKVLMIPKIIAYSLFIVMLLTGLYIFFFRGASNPTMIKFVEILGEGFLNILNLLIEQPNFNCEIICEPMRSLLKEYMTLAQFLLFLVISWLPLYSIFKAAININNTWFNKEKNISEKEGKKNA